MLWVECGKDKDGNCFLIPVSSEQSSKGGNTLIVVPCAGRTGNTVQ